VNRGKGLARTGGPKRTSWAIGPCPFGRRYADEEAAGRSKAGLRPGAAVSPCPNCGGFHVKVAPVVMLSPDAPVKAQRGPGNDPPPQVRLAVAKRSEGLCERCRSARAVHVHHRQPKQAGGTWRRLIHALFNLVHFCTPCHIYVHAHPLESYTAGWLVHSGDDPALVPVITVLEDGTRSPRWLTADGKYSDDDPRTVAAA
jgi:hypothetical protein